MFHSDVYFLMHVIGLFVTTLFALSFYLKIKGAKINSQATNPFSLHVRFWHMVSFSAAVTLFLSPITFNVTGITYVLWMLILSYV